MRRRVLTRKRDGAMFECFSDEIIDEQTVAILYPDGDLESEEVVVWPKNKKGDEIELKAKRVRVPNEAA